MPRKGKGGVRQGTPGTAYSNRTDLNMPISTVPNQEYGMAKAQRDAQRAVPMASSPVSAPEAPAPAPAASKPLPKPGELPFLHPTSNPGAPITSGLPIGAGPGPEAMPQIPLAQKLTSIMSTNRYSPGLADLAAAAQHLGL
jgi:hypothetical protein